MIILNFGLGGEEREKSGGKKSSRCLTTAIQPPRCFYAYPFLPHKPTLSHLNFNKIESPAGFNFRLSAPEFVGHIYW
jgi:hypothetical protein